MHEYYCGRLSGNFKRSGVLAVDEAGNKHLITDTGDALLMGDVSIQCQEPLATLDWIVHDHKLVLLDMELHERNIVMSRKDTEEFMKDTGLRVADTKGHIYRRRNIEIFTGEKLLNCRTKRFSFRKPHCFTSKALNPGLYPVIVPKRNDECDNKKGSNMSNEDMRRLNDEIRSSKKIFERERARLRESGGKKNGCIWLQKRISLAEAWIFGFVAGVLAAIRMDD